MTIEEAIQTSSNMLDFGMMHDWVVECLHNMIRGLSYAGLEHFIVILRSLRLQLTKILRLIQLATLGHCLTCTPSTVGGKVYERIKGWVEEIWLRKTTNGLGMTSK